MGVTHVTSNHDVTTVGQPTENTPDTYSLVETTEKVVEEQVVDESLPTSQRIIDLRPASVNPWDANVLSRDEVRNEEEPHYWSDVNLQDVGLGFEADKEISSEASIKEWFNKMELLNEFQKAVNEVITHMITKVAEEPQGSWHSKQLHEKNVDICGGIHND